jgi:dolichol-phosphate mannosyltransferase
MATPRFLTALPVFNEAQHLTPVLDQVLQFSPDVLVIDDGSSDGTAELLRQRTDLQMLQHPVNRGYGAALASAFDYARQHGFDTLVTIDCDGQHEPRLIPELVAALEKDVGQKRLDIVSGSRYLEHFSNESVPPADRRHINHVITQLLNRTLGLNLTDAFCGFKAYRVESLRHFEITEEGYAMPLQLWVQAVAAGLKIEEYPVPLIYLDEERSFGGALDNARYRLAHYRCVLDRELARFPQLEQPAECGSATSCTTTER